MAVLRVNIEYLFGWHTRERIRIRGFVVVFTTVALQTVHYAMKG